MFAPLNGAELNGGATSSQVGGELRARASAGALFHVERSLRDLVQVSDGTLRLLNFETPGTPLGAGGFDTTLGSVVDDLRTCEIVDGELVVNTSDGDITNAESANDFITYATTNDPRYKTVILESVMVNVFPEVLTSRGLGSNIPRYAQAGIVLGTGTQIPDEYVKLVLAGRGTSNAFQIASGNAIDKIVKISDVSNAASVAFDLFDIADVDLKLTVDLANNTVAADVVCRDAAGNALGGISPESKSGYYTLAPYPLPASIASRFTSDRSQDAPAFGVTSNDYLSLDSYPARWKSLRVSSPEAGYELTGLSLNAQSTASMSPIVEKPIATNLSALASAESDFIRLANIGGLLAGSAATSALFRTESDLTVTMRGTAAASAEARRTARLRGAAVGRAQSEGAAKMVTHLAAIASGRASVIGRLSQRINVGATLEGYAITDISLQRKTLLELRITGRATTRIGPGDIRVWTSGAAGEARSIVVPTSSRVFLKQPSEYLDYDLLFDDWLLVDSTDTIQDIAISHDPGITVGGMLAAPDRVKVWVGGGVDGENYKITVVANTRYRTKEIDFRIVVLEK
nr:hypothetical protein [uncultured Halomonas sp.]